MTPLARWGTIGSMALLLVIIALAVATSRPAAEAEVLGHTPAAPTGIVGPPLRTMTPTPTPDPGQTSQPLELVTRSGILAFADESFGPDYLAIPPGPGHRVEVCGPGGCEILVSTDAGPNRAMLEKGRIADLALGRFARVCGFSGVDEARRRGLCQATWTILP